MIKKNTWVQIHKIILKPAERAENIPADTKNVPLELWVKGYLQNDAQMNDEVTIKTITGRIETGTLVAINPSYQHNYGEFVPEILKVASMVKESLGEVHE